MREDFLRSMTHRAVLGRAQGTAPQHQAQGTGPQHRAQGSTGATLEHPHHCPDPETLLERLQTKDLHTDGRVAESSIWLLVKCETLDFKLLGELVHRDG